MLSINEAATIRGALRFWIDEIVPNGLSTATAYFDRDDSELLTRVETDRLIQLFDEPQLKFAQVDQNQLLDRDDVIAVSRSTPLATVILPKAGNS